MTLKRATVIETNMDDHTSTEDAKFDRLDSGWEKYNAKV